MGLLDGKIAVVTGSTKGIGRGIALVLAREGAKVIINHRGSHGTKTPASDIEETVAMMEKIGGYRPYVIEADCTNEADVENLALTAIKNYGKVDIWVNNVGSHIVTPALPQSKENWEQLFSINTTSCFLGCREAAKVMKNSNGGSIINISSKMGLVGSAENACYCSSKAAVVMMTHCLAAEWAGLNIRVNGVAPGVTLTDPTFKLVEGKPALEAALHYRTPMGRFAYPEEIGNTVVFLASDLSSYITGETIICDGGWIAHSDFAGIPINKLDDWTSEFPKIKKE
ncbi:MAG: SDR family oxidoreductase [Anaerolineaceae bacterium]